MNNAPQVNIQYLVNYDLDITTSGLSLLAKTNDINNENAQIKGKKGFHLCGGSYDEEKKEEIGCLLNGQYTFYASPESSYMGIMGDELSNAEYGFDVPQCLRIKTKNANTYIKSLLIYFDVVAGEFATDISFSEAKKYNPATNQIEDDTTYTSAKIYKNKSSVYIHNFGENSTLTEIRLNIEKWSKRNSLIKIQKVITGYTGIYTHKDLMSVDFDINKTNDEQALRFGVSNNNCTIKVLDNDLMIDTLYKKDLIFNNIQIQVSFDGITQGIFYIESKTSKKGTNEWDFSCIDRLYLLKDIKRPMMAIASRNIYDITNYALSGVVGDVVWEKTAKEYCQSKTIEKSYFKAGQTLYDVLLKCCQVGLLRIYIDRNDICKITSGV